LTTNTPINTATITSQMAMFLKFIRVVFPTIAFDLPR
jgi:hypothetical protein